jgi:anti-sigma factor ChrR (cupin superfamily)
VLFVKLCQYAGPGRKRIVADSGRIEWLPSGAPGIWTKELYSDPNHPERVALLKWEKGARYGRHQHPGGEEILVLDGVLADESGRYPRGTWIRNPPASAHEPYSSEGCALLVKTGGVR